MSDFASELPPGQSRLDGVADYGALPTGLLELLSRLCDGQFMPSDAAALDQMLLADANARRFYYDFIELNSLLTWSGTETAASALSPSSLMGDASAASPSPLMGGGLPAVSLSNGGEGESSVVAGLPTVPPTKSPVLGFLSGVVDYVSQSRTLMFWLIGGTLGLYFAVQFGSLMMGRFWAQNAAQLAEDRGVGTEKHGPFVERPATGKIVARLTNAVDCQWKVAEMQQPSPQPSPIRGEGAIALEVGTEFYAGQKLNLAAGLAELSFDSGAKVILHAPARFDVTDALGGDLQVGKLTAKVPHSASGFTIATPGGKVVDLGTEFGVKVNDNGAMNVIVYVGDVQVESGSGGTGSGGIDQPKVVHVHAGQAVTVGPDHIAKPISPENERFVRDIAPLGDKTKAEAAYVEFMKSLKPVVWFRMEGKSEERVLHNEMGGPDAKLEWDGPGNPFVKGVIGKSLWLRGPKLNDGAALDDYPKAEHGKLSAVAWAYAESRPAWASVLKNWGTAHVGQFMFGLRAENGDLYAGIGGMGDVHEGETHPFSLYEWQHIAFTCDGGTVRLYRQGREVATSNFGAAKMTYPSPVRALGIGIKTDDAGRPGPYCWDGKLDEVALFNAVLTPEAIRKLANSAPR